MTMTELRLRSRVAPETLEAQKGKILTHDDYDVLLAGPSRILKPDGKPLAVYLPGALPEDVLDGSYATLHALKSMETDNRGLASGTQRVKYNEASTRTRSTRPRQCGSPHCQGCKGSLISCLRSPTGFRRR